MSAFYNEIDPYAAHWLRNLIAAGHIAAGVVDERSIVDLDPAELRGYAQCHFFAGIGVWSHALRSAGWPDDRPVWTGSCPCQPFSAAGKGLGHEDERHLWPAWHRLIRECRPATVLGEQVAGADGLGWLDVVLTDLEADDYAVAAADLCAAGCGAPHIRQRLYFVAHDQAVGWREERADGGRVSAGDRAQGRPAGFEPGRDACILADSDGRLASESANGRLAGLQRSGQHGLQPSSGGADELGDAVDKGLQVGQRQRGVPGRASGDDEGQAAQRAGVHPVALAESGGQRRERRQGSEARRVDYGSDAGWIEGDDGPARAHEAGFWTACDWLPCRDGKARPVEPGTFPLAHGAPARVGRLRAYGNAIVAPVAEAFIRSCL